MSGVLGGWGVWLGWGQHSTGTRTTGESSEDGRQEGRKEEKKGERARGIISTNSQSTAKRRFTCMKFGARTWVPAPKCESNIKTI